MYLLNRKVVKKMKQNQKGITLVELIIVLGLIVVVIGVTYNVFFVSSSIFDTGVNKANIQQSARVCSNEIIDSLKFAKQVSKDPISGGNTIYLDNKRIVFEDSAGNKQMFGDYIENLKFESKENGKVVYFEFDVNTGKQQLKMESSVAFANEISTDLSTKPSTIYYTLYP